MTDFFRSTLFYGILGLVHWTVLLVVGTIGAALYLKESKTPHSLLEKRIKPLDRRIYVGSMLVGTVYALSLWINVSCQFLHAFFWTSIFGIVANYSVRCIILLLRYFKQVIRLVDSALYRAIAKPWVSNAIGATILSMGGVFYAAFSHRSDASFRASIHSGECPPLPAFRYSFPLMMGVSVALSVLVYRVKEIDESLGLKREVLRVGWSCLVCTLSYFGLEWATQNWQSYVLPFLWICILMVVHSTLGPALHARQVRRTINSMKYERDLNLVPTTADELVQSRWLKLTIDSALYAEEYSRAFEEFVKSEFSSENVQVIRYIDTTLSAWNSGAHPATWFAPQWERFLAQFIGDNAETQVNLSTEHVEIVQRAKTIEEQCHALDVVRTSIRALLNNDSLPRFIVQQRKRSSVRSRSTLVIQIQP